MEGEIKLKNLLDLFKKNKNKSISTLIILGLVGFFLLTLGKISIQGDYSHKSVDGSTTDIKIPTDQPFIQQDIEKKLEQILAQVEGVGRVKVMLTLETENQVEPAFNTVDNKRVTEENDSEGGTRTITEVQVNKQVVLLNKGGEDEPLLVKKMMPAIKGVLIVADGGESSETVERITQATSTLLGVPVYKIKVLPYSKN
ncbi:stage III sporulation protein AG [Thermosediminibacter oceani]|uniref:Stage III sporulation protein AG n=1 Tax=Thermosediminibacter oceani (strain ATCC BAA-1034 / DSM 16646 / JW/IW-1228P) TaxID=555079 RepID=D9RXJ7_THEOJ|nr:stage III sporulation protein AG [Thermosediminibacter oceani]ADL08071.1 stage III sporulation protein AG [Thermosediminibacter oceani DSM 16646]